MVSTGWEDFLCLVARGGGGSLAGRAAQGGKGSPS